MLSLYEASYLAFEGETLLDEAMAFTMMHLNDLKGDVSQSMAEQVSHALEVPLHHRMLRLEARWYIEAYSKREDAISLLLELAKLDFNIVQSVFQRELQDMSR
jgi:isoprene synthase